MSVSAYTAHYRISKIDYASRGWQTVDWANLDLIDSLLFAGAANGVPFIAATGTVDVITLTFSPAITYTSGQQISFTASGANTGAVTVNANGLGAKSLRSTSGSLLTAGQITTGMYVRAIYNGTLFTIIDPNNIANTASLTAPVTINFGLSGATANSAADELGIENNDDVGMSILSPAAKQARILFGRPLAPTAGGIRYDHVNDKLILRAGATDVFSITTAGVVDLGSTGYVIQSGLVYFNAHHPSAATNLPASNSIVVFPTELSDNGAHYDNTTGLFTAPAAGTYRFDADFSGIYSTSTFLKGQFYKNGSAVGSEILDVFAADAAANRAFHISLIITLALNDTIGFHIFISGGTVTSWAGNFCGQRIA